MAFEDTFLPRPRKTGELPDALGLPPMRQYDGPMRLPATLQPRNDPDAEIDRLLRQLLDEL